MTFRLGGRDRRRAIGVLCTFLVAAAFAGCAKKERAAKSVATRVVSLSPSTTETMYAIGAESLLVGRSRYCDYPPAVLALPQVGGYVDPNLEAILGLRPDLVIGARGPAGQTITERLAAQGASTYFPETESIAAIDAMIRELGKRTGHDAEAAKVVADLDAREDAITKTASAAPKVRVVLVFGLEPIVVAGPKSFPDEMLARAGAVNAITEGTTYPVVGIERIIALDPDLVLNAAMGEARGTERITAGAAGWREVRAVKEGHVIGITDESVLRPGPRVADGIRTIAHAVHPSLSLP